MLLLRNPIQPYAWGPHDGMAVSVGTEPTGGPEAELWIGAHPRGTSVVAAGEHAGQALVDVIADDPDRWLGPELVAAGAATLPFLLKVLAIEAPLSLQAHPSTEQALAGFAREDAAGIPVDAPNRTYRDRSAKPEMLVALTDTWALCGFRSPADAGALLAAAPIPALAPLIAVLQGPGPVSGRLEAAMHWLVNLDELARTAIHADLTASLAERTPSGDGDPWRWVAELVGGYPGDPLCLAPLLLELIHLAPGDAVHLPAGNLHAYLRGVGVEVMASSDNVLRGGLTEKYVDADELLAILRFEVGSPAAPVQRVEGAWTIYDAAEADFELGTTAAPANVEVGSRGPMVVLAVGAPAAVRCGGEVLEVDPGQAVLLEPGSTATVSGAGSIWCATTGGSFRAQA